MIRSKHTRPLAISIYAGILAAAGLGVWDLARSSAWANLSGAAEKGAYLLLQQSVFLFIATAYAMFVGFFLGGLHRIFNLDDGLGRLWRRLKEKRFDTNAASAIITGAIALAGLMISMRLMLGTKSPEFFEKTFARTYFGAITVVLVLMWGALSVALFARIRAILAPLRQKIAMPLSAIMIGAGLFGMLALFALVVLRVRGDENYSNVIKTPLMMLITVGLHGLCALSLFLLRERQPFSWLWRPAVRFPVYLLLVLCIGYGALRTDRHPTVKSAITSHTEYQQLAVSLVQGLIDLDGDGFSAVFGGADCNDFNKNINPNAEDIPGNGIDEDCRDGDRQLVATNHTPQQRGDLLPSLVKKGAVLQKKPVSPTTQSGRVVIPETRMVQPKARQVTPGTPKTPPTSKSNGKTPVTTQRVAPQLKTATRRFNVVVILVDTLRADHVSFYGYPRKTTPTLDALAKRSIVFKHAYAPSNNTPKSMPSIFASRYPSDIKWKRKYRNYPQVLPENVMIGEELQRGGYTTVGLSAHFYFEKRRANFVQGFDHWDNRGALNIKGSNTQIAGPLITKKVAEWLPKLAKGKKPFFLFVHYFEPHSRYMWHDHTKQWGKALVDKYDGEILYTDGHVARVLALLKQQGLDKNTVVIVTSDHGEGFNEHKFYFHGQTLYNEVLHVPLMIHVPGLPHRQIERRVSLLDLFPTILGLARIKSEVAIRGHSLQPLFSNPAAPHDFPIFAELLRYPNWKQDIKAMIVGDLKLIYHMTRNTWELYDLAADPGERKNLFFKHPQAKALRAQLLHFMDNQLGKLP